MKPEDYQAAILSAVINDFGVIHQVAPYLVSESLTKKNGIVWEGMLSLYSSEIPIDIPSLSKILGDKIDLGYLRELEGSLLRLGIHSTRGVMQWWKILDRISRIRQLKVLLEDKLKEEPAQIESYCTEIIDGIRIIQGEGREGFRILSEIADRYLQIAERAFRGEVIERQPVYWPSWDSRLGGGLPLPELTIIAARPSQGKTQLALQILRNVAEEIIKSGEDAVVGFFSLEMRDTQVMKRLVCSGAEVDGRLLEAGALAGDQQAQDRFYREMEELKKLPILVDDSTYLSADAIEYRASLLATKAKLKLIVIDFAELVKEEGATSEELRVSSIYRKSKEIAKKLGIPVILLGQLNRNVDFTLSKVPTMRSIRYSGMAEAVAGLVILIYWPEFYRLQGDEIRTPKGMPIVPDTSYIIISKNRDGDIGYFPFGWQRQFTRFYDLEAGGERVRVGGGLKF